MPMQRGAVVFYVLMVALTAVMSFAVGHCIGFNNAECEIPVVGKAEEGFFIKPLFPISEVE